MPSLEFKGKQHIYAHHLTVPYRPLVADPAKSLPPIKAADFSPDPRISANISSNLRPDASLIIHGDNLHALKALLPRYAGRVKCIYIDPPYNTGSQAWVFNDNVNSPLMQAWLKSSVDLEDLERHDKWLCMMWPRLHLLRELLSDDGAIFVSIDDHEQWRLLGLMEEVFGEQNFVDTLVLIQNLGAVSGKWLREVNEHIHVFAKDISQLDLGTFVKAASEDGWLKDEWGDYRLGSGLIRIGMSGTPADRPNLHFPIFVGDDLSISTERVSPSDVAVYPTDGQGNPAVWRWGKQKVDREPHNLLIKPHSRMGYQFTIKIRPSDSAGNFRQKPTSLWNKPSYSAASGTNAMKAIFDGERRFNFPKAVALVEDVLRFANVGPNDIVLDSFAGSGTTAHAVLALNKADGGNRQFILVECEDYADTITAERVRRVIQGVPGARDKALQEGLGGSFAYCTLGAPIDPEKMLTGEALPSWSSLAAYLLHTAAGLSVAGELQPQDADGRFYETETAAWYLFYQPEINWLRSSAAVLTEDQAKRIHSSGKAAYVFAADKYIGQRMLTDLNITFCQLPYELHRRGW